MPAESGDTDPTRNVCAVCIDSKQTFVEPSATKQKKMQSCIWLTQRCGGWRSDLSLFGAFNVQIWLWLHRRLWILLLMVDAGLSHLTHLLALVMLWVLLLVMMMLLVLFIQIDHIRHNGRLVVIIALIQVQNVRIIPIRFEIDVVWVGRLGCLHSTQQIFIVQNVHVFNVLTQFHASQFVGIFAQLVDHRHCGRLAADGIRRRQLMIRLIIFVIVVGAATATAIRGEAFFRTRVVRIVCVRIILFTVKPFTFMRIGTAVLACLLVLHFHCKMRFLFFQFLFSLQKTSADWNRILIQHNSLRFWFFHSMVDGSFHTKNKFYSFSTQLKSESKFSSLLRETKTQTDPVHASTTPYPIFTVRPNGKRFHTHIRTTGTARCANVATHSCGKCETTISLPSADVEADDE